MESMPSEKDMASSVLKRLAAIDYDAIDCGPEKSAPVRMPIEHFEIQSPLGRFLAAYCPRGICHLDWLEGAGADGFELAGLRRRFPQADIKGFSPAVHHGAAAAKEWIDWALMASEKKPQGAAKISLALWGSPWNFKVWAQLAKRHAAGPLRYAELAALAGSPKAARAAGRSCAANCIALLIPCHLAIPAEGGGEYKWGAWRKRLLLGEL